MKTRPKNELHLVEPENLLAFTIGDRIRHYRALLGISRKILSSRAKVSERHLAQIETGTGNVSIRLLGQIATALGVQAQELLVDQADSSAEEILLQDALSKLTTDQLTQILDLAASLAPAAAPITNIVSLIGLRGAGKSTLGSLLAQKKQVPFVRITEAIEQLAGMTISEIHSLSGEPGYRRYELLAVQNALMGKNSCIIETGGSLVANTPAFNLLLQESLVVWLQANPEDHMNRVVQQGDLRPMEGRSDAMDDLIRILKERNTLYSQAHARLDTSNTTTAKNIQELEALTLPVWRST